MSSSPENLTPPKRTNTEDPGAHELDSDSEEHFSDAQSNVMSPVPASPVPRTRVEKVSDEPSYGEVPGTEAYNKRTGDAAPDEIAVVPDANKPDGAPAENEEDKAQVGSASGRESPLPGGQPIPVTVVEEATGDSGPHSEVFENKRKADAPPDLVVKPDGGKGGTSDSGRRAE
jgi:hypothetical protein